MNNSSGTRGTTLRSFGEQIGEVETRWAFIIVARRLPNAFAEDLVGVSIKLSELEKKSIDRFKSTSSKGDLVVLSREGAVAEPACLEGVEKELGKMSSPFFEQLNGSSRVWG